MNRLGLKVYFYSAFLLGAYFWFMASMLFWEKGIPQALWRACTSLSANGELPILLITLMFSISLVFGATFLIAFLIHYYRSFRSMASAESLLIMHEGKEAYWLLPEEKVFAYTSGFIKSKIVISSGLASKLSPLELEAVYLHESYHARHQHTWISFVAKLSPYVLYFVPFVKDIRDHVLLLLEQAADEFVVQRQGTSRYLKNALIHTIEGEGGLTGVHFGERLLEERIDFLAKNKTPVSSWMFWKMSVVLLFMGLSSLFLLHRPTASFAFSEGKECTLEVMSLTLFSPLPRASFPFSPAQ